MIKTIISAILVSTVRNFVPWGPTKIMGSNGIPQISGAFISSWEETRNVMCSNCSSWPLPQQSKILPFHGLGDVVPFFPEISKILLQEGRKIPFSDHHNWGKKIRKEQKERMFFLIVSANRAACAREWNLQFSQILFELQTSKRYCASYLRQSLNATVGIIWPYIIPAALAL